MPGDAQARAVLEDAFASRGIAPSLAELQVVQAIARFEGGYGQGWKGEGKGSHNWGAIQCGHYAPCQPGCFETGDSHADGEKYRGCFRIYPSAVAGAADLVRELYRRPGVPEAARDGDARLVAERMRASGYFEAPADRYGAAIADHAAAIAKALGEPLAVGADGPPDLPSSPPAVPVAQNGGGGLGALFVLGLLGLAAARRAWS